MAPIYRGGDVTAYCPSCHSRSNFVMRDGTREFGNVDGPAPDLHPRVLLARQLARVEGKDPPSHFTRTVGLLLHCSTCHWPGLVHVACANTISDGMMLDFYPREGYPAADLPAGTPDDVAKEFREAERCAAAGAWRAGSALMRSALEKTLIANGYSQRNLEPKIDAAAEDGVITQARKQRAHQEVRVLGNDVLHDEWKLVTEDDFAASHHYTHRVIEDLYDDRSEVEKLLIAADRISAPEVDRSDTGNET